MRILILFVLIFINIIGINANTIKIPLSGNWTVFLDSTLNETGQVTGLNFKGNIVLPGTTDDAGIGLSNLRLPKLEKPQVLRLTRKSSFIGKAIYKREFLLPKRINNKRILLKFERILWQSEVLVNGQKVEGVQESLSAPHYFDITNFAKTGINKLELGIDNRKKYDISVNNMAHAYTNETQIMWNGVLGEMSCMILDKVTIENVQIYPDIANKTIRVIVHTENYSGKKQKGNLTLRVFDKNESKNTISLPVSILPQKSTVEYTYKLGDNAIFWDEFNPHLYTLETKLKCGKNESQQATVFGMRSISGSQSMLQINGRPIFLRGTLECAIFPLTGYPPMTKEGWFKVFDSARQWGLNHLRFHSWCPPKAAFEVADELGFYLQVELPLWSLTVNKDTATTRFLYDEADRIIREYGNHPSFCFWSIGNELQPDFKYLNAFVKQLKLKDNRHLYTATSYTFEKGHGQWPEPEDDFFITQTTKKGWVRGQGVFDSESPSFAKDYSVSVEGMQVPLITHEIGQYAVYPNLKEIEKYSGVLDPLNFKAVKADLKEKNLIHKANDYLMASGKLAAILYKEEIERALKTTGISGFQLLDLHDFPGQGTALVGLLDAFWDSKGLIKAEEFRMFCSPVVPLLRFDKATYTNKEQFRANIQIANFSNNDLKNTKLNWKLTDDQKIIKAVEIPIHALTVGSLTDVGEVRVDLSEIKTAKNLKISVEIEQTDFRNEWQIWVYPEKTPEIKSEVSYTRDLSTAIGWLNQGKKVLYNPYYEQVKGLDGKFVPVFWSPVHFPKQAGTMGMLCNPDHKVFEKFPTEMHTNWQWWSLLKNSKTILVDSIPGLKPIVEMVDNFNSNRKLCNTFEAKVGKGTLMFTTIDLDRDIEKRPEARQFIYSLMNYMNSENFAPEFVLQLNFLKELISDVQIKSNNNPESIY